VSSATGTRTRRRQAIEGQADLGREDAGDRGRHHAARRAREQSLAKPAFQYGDLPADRTVCQAELGCRLDVAVRARGDLEDAERVERWQSAHLLM